LKEKIFYGIFSYMFKEKETLDETIMAWKKYGGNQCKIVIISKIWSRFWVNRDFGFVANWSTHLYTYPHMFYPWIPFHKLYKQGVFYCVLTSKWTQKNLNLKVKHKIK
jgi:hypothetical protein